jgi:hypothetical protein
VIDVHLKILGEDKQAPLNEHSGQSPHRYAIEVTYFSSPNKSVRTLVRSFPEPEDYQTVVKELNKIARKINSLKRKEIQSVEK